MTDKPKCKICNGTKQVGPPRVQGWAPCWGCKPGMKIFVSEEYGYRSWIWHYPHDKEQLIKDWKAGRAPLDFFDPRKSDFDGELVQIKEWSLDIENSADAWVHTHEPADNILVVGDRQIPQDPEKYNAGRINWPRKNSKDS